MNLIENASYFKIYLNLSSFSKNFLLLRQIFKIFDFKFSQKKKFEMKKIASYPYFYSLDLAFICTK